VSTAVTGVSRTSGQLESDDGLRLFWQAWIPASPQAVLLIVHGLAEHSGRYEHVAERFAGRGYACYAVDYRGHGQSPGPRVHVSHFDLYLGDVRGLHRLAAGRHQGVPVFLVGHSQGGLIAIHYVFRHAAGLRGLVLSAPFLAVHADSAPPRIKRLGARVLGRVYPSLVLPNPLDVTRLSHDPAVGEAYLRDPLVSRKVSPGWFRAVRQAQREITARAPLLPLPSLIMAGSGDTLVDPQAIRRWAEQAPADRVEFVWWDGLYHELFNETAKEAVFSRVQAWLERRLGPA
jgi:acylglycerol lipase